MINFVEKPVCKYLLFCETSGCWNWEEYGTLSKSADSTVSQVQVKYLPGDVGKPSFRLHLFDILNQFRYNTAVGHPHFCSFRWKAFPF
jgi:hypothetical protein